MKQQKILIIDDNHDLADGLGMILEDEGYQVVLAYNGEDGIRFFNEGDFDVVFVDVKLPDMSGIEVFQAVHNKKPEVRILMMTGYRVEQLLAEVVDNGDVVVLRKPIEIEHVEEVLVRIKNESIILVADDDPDCAERLSAHLTARGIKVCIGRNKEVVESVTSDSVDVLVLDLHKSIICALEVYLQLKQQNRAVKTVIVTGCTDNGLNDGDILRSTQVTGCLFKPFNPEYMLQAIEQVAGC